MRELKKLTLSGIKWVFFVTLIQRILSFATTIFLARILEPADFGLFALAFVMIDGLSILKSLGIDSALVRRKEDFDKAANTAFLLIPLTGLVLFIVIQIFAPIAARFMNSPAVGNVIRILGIVFVISCFGRVPQTILYKEMKFKIRSMAELSAKLVYIFIVIILALKGCGVWSLVTAYIFQNLVQVSIEWYFSGWRPKFEFDIKIAGEMIHFGKFLLASSIIGFIYSNLDNLLIGKLLGVTMLGYYAFARAISNYLNEYFFSRIAVIMYPAYSKIQDNNDSIKNAFIKIIKYISIATFPFACYFLIFSFDFLHTFFGNKWVPASNVLRILVIVGVFNSLEAAFWPIFLAKGQSKTDFQLNLINVGLFLVLVIPLTIKIGLIGAGVALLISTIISFTVGIIRIKRTIEIDFMIMLKSIYTALLASLIMFSIGIALKQFTISNNLVVNLLTKSVLLGVFYIIFLYILDKQIIFQIKSDLCLSEKAWKPDLLI